MVSNCNRSHTAVGVMQGFQIPAPADHDCSLLVGFNPWLWHILLSMNPKEPGEDNLKAQAVRSIDDFITLYRAEVVSSPHRTVLLTGRKCGSPRIISTLLGYELQIRDKRINCPDMTTALFLKIFALIGTREAMIPHDPTRTAELIPAFEGIWDQFEKICRQLESKNSKSLASSLHRRLKARIQETE